MDKPPPTTTSRPVTPVDNAHISTSFLNYRTAASDPSTSSLVGIPKNRRSLVTDASLSSRLERLSLQTIKSSLTNNAAANAARPPSGGGGGEDGRRGVSYDTIQYGPMPPPDYFYRSDVAINDLQLDQTVRVWSEEGGEDDNNSDAHKFTPVGRNAVEMKSLFYVERNLFSYLANTTLLSDRDYHSGGRKKGGVCALQPRIIVPQPKMLGEDEGKLLPPFAPPPPGSTFLILGKPGIGKTTLARKLANRLQLIHINPELLVEAYRSHRDFGIEETLASGATVSDKVLLQLLRLRTKEPDTEVKGYVLEGFPLIISDDEEVTVERQLKVIKKLVKPPKYIFCLNMQDADLYKRRIEQKYDPETSLVYPRSQYSSFSPDYSAFSAGNKQQPKKAGSGGEDDDDDEEDEDDPFEEEPLDGSKDFLPLSPNVIFRLKFRSEDQPVFVNDDLERFRKALPLLQAFVDGYDKRNVLVLDAYWAPSVVFKRSLEFLECRGILGFPAVVTVMGPPKSGKTTLAKKLAAKLGLVYISGTNMIENIIKHSFVSQFADILSEVEPRTLEGGPQPMILAEEVLSYLRNGLTVPRFLVYRVLDIVLEQPRAQFHGVVFDDYPVTEEELQELLYRGMVPSVVTHLGVGIREAYERVKRDRPLNYNYDEVLDDGLCGLEFATTAYKKGSETGLYWFGNELQNTLVLDAGRLSEKEVYKEAVSRIKRTMKKMQAYLVNMLLELPSTLEDTCPLTSQIPSRLSPEFGQYCPVSLYERDELIRVEDPTDLTRVVEYKGYFYMLEGEANVAKFLANPDKYLPPNCPRVVPEELPMTCCFDEGEFAGLAKHWGFEGYDPVRFFFMDQSPIRAALVKGDPKYCVAYKDKLYCFVNEENMARFMRRPYRYADLQVPSKILEGNEGTKDLESCTSYSYLLNTGLLPKIREVIKLAGESRARVPFKHQSLCAAMFMGYYFRSQGNEVSYETRKKYRDAMTGMLHVDRDARAFHTRVEKEAGYQLGKVDQGDLEDFLGMETRPIEDIILAPDKVPGPLSLDEVTISEEGIADRVTVLKQMVKGVCHPTPILVYPPPIHRLKSTTCNVIPNARIDAEARGKKADVLNRKADTYQVYADVDQKYYKY